MHLDLLSTVVHIKTRLDLLGIQTLRWDQRLHTELLHGIGSTVYIIVTLIVM